MIIGIDVGGSGAIVALGNDGTHIDHMLMPTITHGKSKRVNGAAVGAFLSKLGEQSVITHCYIEKVGAMPQQGVSSTFVFGHAAGLVEGVVTGMAIPITLVTPQAWKKHAGLIGQDKDAARSRAIQLYPDLRILDLKAKGQAVADALLIARYGLSISD